MFTILKRTILLFSLALLSLIISCDSTESPGGDVTTVDVIFKALYNGDPLVMNNRYIYDGKEISFSKLQFYISDLSLVSENMEISINEIDFIDFTNNNINETDAINGIKVSKASIPVGNYEGIKLGIGVPSDLNENTPVDYSSSHPLGQASEYWSNWNSYIFSKLEGKFDQDGDPTILEGDILHHIGMDEMLREKEVTDLDIAVKTNTNTEVIIELDVFDILNGTSTNSSINLDLEGFTHTNPTDQGQVDLATKIANNWKSATSIR